MTCKKDIESEPEHVVQKKKYINYQSTCAGCGEKHDLFVFYKWSHPYGR